MTKAISQIIPRIERRLDYLIVLGLFLIILVPLLKVLLKPNQVAYGITEVTGDFELFYAYESIQRDALDEGEWILWNPYFAPGVPFGSIGALYPIFLLLRELPITTAAVFNWDTILHMWLAGLGMYALVRDLGGRRSAAVFSSVAVTFSGIVIPRFLAGQPRTVRILTWAIWVLLFYRRMLHKQTWMYLLLAITSVVLAQLVFIHPQYVIMVYLMPVSYFFYFAIQQLRDRAWRRLALGFVMSLLVAVLAVGLLAIRWIPILELSRHAWRTSGEFSLDMAYVVSLGLGELVMMFMPLIWVGVPTWQRLGFAAYFEIHPFVGVITLGLAPLALFAADKNSRRVALYLAIVACIGLALAIDGSPLFALLHTLVPILGNSGRFSFIWVVYVAVLGGLGLETLIQALSKQDNHTTIRRLRLVTIVLGFASAAALAVVILWKIEGIQLTTALQSAGYFDFIEADIFVLGQQRNLGMLLLTLFAATGLAWAATRKRLHTSVWGWLVVGGIVFEMYLFAWPMIVPQDATRLYDPTHPMAVLDLDPSEVRLENAGRLGPIYQAPSLGMNNPVGLSIMQPIRQLGMNGGRGSQLMAGGYYVSQTPLTDPELEEIQHSGSAYLYAHTDRWPRIYAAPAAHVVTDETEALALVADEEFDPFAVAIVIVDDERPNLPSSPSGELVEATAEFLDYRLNSLSARVEADHPVMVVFSETYYPGWNAWVDGEPAVIWRTNYAFRGVIVDAGEHVIDMAYRPKSFTVGATISAITLVILVILTVAYYVVRMRSRDGRDVEASVGEVS